MLNPASFSQSLHMTLAAFATTGIAVAGIHAWMLRRDPSAAFHRAALKVALMVAVPASLLQVVSGDLSAKFLAKWQPVKLAALEGHFETERGASLVIGGIPDVSAGSPAMPSRSEDALGLAFGDPDAEVRGLNAFPREDWPPVAVTHLAFQIMVGLGALMALASLWVILCWIRSARSRTIVRWLTFPRGAHAAGFIAVEAGWSSPRWGASPGSSKGSCAPSTP